VLPCRRVLHYLYVTQELKIRHVATVFGTDSDTVRKWINTYHLKRSKSKCQTIVCNENYTKCHDSNQCLSDVEYLRWNYVICDLSAEDVSSMAGCRPSQVRSAAKRFRLIKSYGDPVSHFLKNKNCYMKRAEILTKHGIVDPKC